MLAHPVENRSVHSQASWVFSTDEVEVAVTELGAHMAPVTFCRNGVRPIMPYYISPWQNENPADFPVGLPGVLVPLRGDFFCLPFGGNGDPYRGERHPAHGETAGKRWTLDGLKKDRDTSTLAIHLVSSIRPGIIRREFTLRKGHNAVYCRTLVENWKGRTPFAHHATLRVPDRERTLQISTIKFSFGQTYPVALANPDKGDYQWVAQDKPFRSLSKIPSIFGTRPCRLS